MENDHWKLHIDDVHSVLKTEDLSNLEQIFSIIQYQIMTTFGTSIERISLSFIKEIIRNQILLTFQDFQNLNEALNFFKMITESNQTTMDTVKALPDMA